MSEFAFTAFTPMRAQKRAWEICECAARHRHRLETGGATPGRRDAAHSVRDEKTLFAMLARDAWMW
jgi:hypothetical protein